MSSVAGVIVELEFVLIAKVVISSVVRLFFAMVNPLNPINTASDWMPKVVACVMRLL